MSKGDGARARAVARGAAHNEGGRYLRAGDDAAAELAAAAVLLAVADLGVRVGPRVANLLRPRGEGELVERVADAVERARGPARRVFHTRGADLAREDAKLAGRLAEREERFGRHVLEDQHQELSEQHVGEAGRRGSGGRCLCAHNFFGG